jgi:hypothetical protein
MMSFIPDELMLKIQYKIKTDRKLKLESPQRYTEKLQWYKLYYRDPLMAQCVDKYEVRKYVEKVGLGYILNELYGVYDSPDEIDFDELPNSFVLKDTLGGGGNSVIIIRDKKLMDIPKVYNQMLEWVNEPTNKKHPGREWVYDGRNHRIIVEKLLEGSNGDLPDYKFFCFNGKMQYFYIRSDYAKNHKDAKVSIFDRYYNYLQGVGWDYCGVSLEKPELCSNIKKMIETAEMLASQFPHVRVDLYNVDGKIYFGELTFFHASGYFKFEPDNFDYEMGNKFRLPIL